GAAVTREEQEALEQIRELVDDRARLELYALHVMAELQASITYRGGEGLVSIPFCRLTGEQAMQLVRLGRQGPRLDRQGGGRRRRRRSRRASRPISCGRR